MHRKRSGQQNINNSILPFHFTIQLVNLVLAGPSSIDYGIQSNTSQILFPVEIDERIVLRIFKSFFQILTNEHLVAIKIMKKFVCIECSDPNP